MRSRATIDAARVASGAALLGAMTLASCSGADGATDSADGGPNAPDGGASSSGGSSSGGSSGTSGADAGARDGAAIEAGRDAAPPDSGPVVCSDAGALPLHCASKPSACCYPDETNTGVPPGTKLTPRAGGEIQTAGTVIDGAELTDTLDIYANNVTIRNSHITVASSGSFGVAIRPGVTGTLIEDTTIQGQDNSLNSVEYAIDNMSDSLLVVRRVNLFNCSECIAGGSILVTDSFIHDTADPPGAHVENIYGYSGVTLRHNTMFNAVGQTAVVYVQGVSDNCEVTDNLLAGGGYTIYGGSSSTKDSSNFVIKNNRFSKMYYPSSGYYGVVAYYNASGPGDAWTGNFWDETGAPVTP
jgi:hypothetical protein